MEVVVVRQAEEDHGYLYMSDRSFNLSTSEANTMYAVKFASVAGIRLS